MNGIRGRIGSGSRPPPHCNNIDIVNDFYWLPCVYKKTGPKLIVRALVLEPIDPGSILTGGFLEGHDFTAPHERFGGWPPKEKNLECGISGSSLQRAMGHSSPI